MTDTSTSTFFVALQWLPTMIVLAAGAVLALVNMRRLRAGATILAAIGCVVVILDYLGQILFALNSQSFYDSFGSDHTDEASSASNMVWIVFGFVEAIGMALILAAILVGRRPRDAAAPVPAGPFTVPPGAYGMQAPPPPAAPASPLVGPPGSAIPPPLDTPPPSSGGPYGQPQSGPPYQGGPPQSGPPYQGGQPPQGYPYTPPSR